MVNLSTVCLGTTAFLDVRRCRVTDHVAFKAPGSQAEVAFAMCLARFGRVHAFRTGMLPQILTSLLRPTHILVYQTFGKELRWLPVRSTVAILHCIVSQETPTLVVARTTFTSDVPADHLRNVGPY